MNLAATATSIRKGNAVFVMVMVIAVFTGRVLEAGRDIFYYIIGVEYSERQIMASTVIKAEITVLARLRVSSAVLVLWYSVNVERRRMKAPSAKRSARRFGIRNAALKASVILPAPKRPAKVCSRKRPKILDKNVAKPT